MSDYTFSQIKRYLIDNAITDDNGNIVDYAAFLDAAREFDVTQQEAKLAFVFPIDWSSNDIRDYLRDNLIVVDGQLLHPQALADSVVAFNIPAYVVDVVLGWPLNTTTNAISSLTTGFFIPGWPGPETEYDVVPNPPADNFSDPRDDPRFVPLPGVVDFSPGYTPPSSPVAPIPPSSGPGRVPGTPGTLPASTPGTPPASTPGTPPASTPGTPPTSAAGGLSPMAIAAAVVGLLLLS